MAEVKDKVVTVEALSALHQDNKKSYMTKADPMGTGTMTMDGDAVVSGNVNVGSISIGSNVKLVPAEDRIEIIFVNEEETKES